MNRLAADKKQVSVVIPKDLYEMVISPKAKREQRSVSNVLSIALVNYYQTTGEYPPTTEEENK